MDPAETRYDRLVDEVELRYGEGRLREAADLLTDWSGLEPWSAELAHLKACVLGASGDADGALRTLLTASAAGAWWRAEILTDDDLDGLQDHPEFAALVKLSESRVTDEVVPPTVDLPEGPPAGVVVALHGAGQTAAHARRDWSAVPAANAAPDGYALVCVQSSYRMSPRYRTWPDPGQARADIARALATLPAELQELPVIAAGFSAGARVAVDWALTARPTPVRGVLAMAPALRALPGEQANLLSPATIWIGTGDELLEVVDRAEEKLTAFTIERIPGLGHTFPGDFPARVRRILQDSWRVS